MDGRRLSPILTGAIALLLSLLLHAGMAVAILMFNLFNLNWQRPDAGAWGKGEKSDVESRSLIAISPPEPIQNPAETPPLPKPPVPKPEAELPERTDEEFGAANGKGSSPNANEGETPLQARQGPQDQAALSRDPVGPGKELLDDPALTTVLPGNNGAGGHRGGPLSPPALLEQPQASTAFGPSVPSQAVQPALVQRPPVKAVAPQEQKEMEAATTSAPPKPAEKPDPQSAIALNVQSEVIPEKSGKGITPEGKEGEGKDREDRKSVEAREGQKLPSTRPTNKVAEEGSNKPFPPSASATAAPDGALSASKTTPTAASSARPVQVATGPGGTPGQNLPAADPSPMSESESDAFRKAGSVHFRNGKLEARIGRSFKSSKPRLTIKAQLDLISLPNPSITMKVTIDDTGKVTDVQIIKSSGSNEVDLPTELAMYKWWIEPLKSKSGKPLPDVLLITFNYL